MQPKYAIRLVSPIGGISVFLNGFLIFAPEDIGRSVTQASPFIRSGENIIEIRKHNLKASVEFSLADIAEGDPVNAPILVSFSTKEIKVDAPIVRKFWLNNPLPIFQWHTSEELTAIENEVDPLYLVLKNLASALETGSDIELMRILDVKHREIAQAVGLKKTEMNTGLSKGLARLRNIEGFAVQTPELKNLLLLKSSNGNVVNARRKSGGHALKIIDGDENHGFSVSFVKIDGHWIIAR